MRQGGGFRAGKQPGPAGHLGHPGHSVVPAAHGFEYQNVAGS